MWNNVSLLALALTLALPALADPPKLKAPASQQINKPKTSSVDTFNFSTEAAIVVPTKSNGVGARAGKPNLGAITVTNKCKKPNPPPSCKQAKPPH